MMHSYRNYVVRRGGRVYHRATGLLLGTVVKAPWGMDVSTSGAWHAYTPHCDEAVGDIEPTMHRVIQHLMDPSRIKPWGPCRRLCKSCRNRSPQTTCENCESEEAAAARNRLENAAEWAHYDAVCALPENEAYRARSAHDQHEQDPEVPDQGDDHGG